MEMTLLPSIKYPYPLYLVQRVEGIIPKRDQESGCTVRFLGTIDFQSGRNLRGK